MPETPSPSTPRPHQPASLKALGRHRRVLLLQGPMGPFFAQLAQWLAGRGAQVLKVHFNGGDELVGGIAAGRNLRFAEPAAAWPQWLAHCVAEHRIDALVLFGQARPLHEAALAWARAQGLPCYVFEEGYLRPDYVTLEKGGVNGHSSLSADPAFYRRQPRAPQPVTLPTRSSFWSAAKWAVLYSLALALLARRYPHYASHRCLCVLAQSGAWLRSGLRRVRFGWRERGVTAALAARSRRWFLVPLQVHNDAQMVHHSPYATVQCVIREVLASFAAHAARDQWLVFKHHPMDRGYRDYTALIAREAAALGVGERVLAVHDLHLPTLLRHTRGVVTVNSTAGIQALHHGAPVKALGEAVYALPGLVSARPLAQFWTDPGRVDRDLWLRFRNHVVRHTQLNASFYADTPALTVGGGLIGAAGATPTPAAGAAESGMAVGGAV